jgi:hypothetical protein
MKTRTLTLAVSLGFITLAAVAETAPGFVAHEWGTFTDVQGADGVQMDWNPLVISELPKFVYDRARVRSSRLSGVVVAGKLGTIQRQRMETPVIYFYSDRTRTVDVAVRFPEGRITEWYPLESAALLGVAGGNAAAAAQQPALHWKDVQVLPQSAPAPALITETSGSHYYAARATDASLVRTLANGKLETEKFLFYRGTGEFKAPLTAKLDGPDSSRLSLSNSGGEPLPALFVCAVSTEGRVAWTPVETLAAGGTQSVDLGHASFTDEESLKAALRSALVHQGLYEKEAAAMVDTWASSWLGDPGVRVLYTLPRAWTDRTLPLAITPAPQSIERVMVGRAEIITPAMEHALLSSVTRYIAAQPEERPKIVAETRALGMGRFTEAALRRLFVTGARSNEFSALSWELLQAASAPSAEISAAASK